MFSDGALSVPRQDAQVSFDFRRRIINSGGTHGDSFGASDTVTAGFSGNTDVACSVSVRLTKESFVAGSAKISILFRYARAAVAEPRR